MVQLFNGSDPSGGNGSPIGIRTNIDKTHAMQAEIMDQPTAALISDMKRRGFLKTPGCLVYEFGRMPFLQGNGTGRDHNPDAFTCFFAGAGVRRVTATERVIILALRVLKVSRACMILMPPFFT